MNKREMLTKTPEEIRQNFEDAFGLLRALSGLYDQGDKAAAIELAGIVYVFAYDRGRSQQSILSLIGRKGVILFKNTALKLNDQNMLSQPALTEKVLGPTGMQYQAPLDRGIEKRYEQPDQSLTEWWATPIFIEDLTEESQRIGRRWRTREDLVLHLRHREGGGHVGESIERFFADLKRSPNFMTGANFVIERRDGKKERVLPEHGPEYASMRQIAYEVEQSLLTTCADLLS